MNEIPPPLAEQLKLQREHQSRFGHIRPAIHTDWQGHKWVAIGDQLLNSPHWKTPLDFLGDYLKYVMTPKWGKDELKRPLSERHPVMQWYDSLCRLQSQAALNAGKDGQFSLAPSGAARAYYLLAYDLYVLQHHDLLEDRLVQRLRHKDQYQGARHELFAAATCVRGGFDIVYEDETVRSTKHTEFSARHRGSGTSVCVEAKSKHRAGVLGMKGDRAKDDEIRTRLGKLIGDALKKPRQHPLVLFIDLNLPVESPASMTPEWFRSFADPILRDLDRKGCDDPWDLLVFSNQPDHYLTDDGPAPGGYSLGMVGKNARIGNQPGPELFAIVDAANKFGSMPNSFDEM